MNAPGTYIVAQSVGTAYALGPAEELLFAPLNADGSIDWDGSGSVEFGRIDPEVEFVARAALRALHTIHQGEFLREFCQAVTA